jgi:hypothetical protein
MPLVSVNIRLQCSLLGRTAELRVCVGINKGHVEDMESRLKQDVLKEAEKYGNQVMVTHEDDDYQIVQKWEAVTEVDVQTPLDVYRELEGELLCPLIPGQCPQHSTAQHSTAQHSTAQHSTAQHSTAQHSTAQPTRSSLSSCADQLLSFPVNNLENSGCGSVIHCRLQTVCLLAC